MLSKLKIVAIVIVSVATLVCGSAIIHADNELHVHGEDCVYSCVLDNVNTAGAFTGRGHVDHEGSGNCLYSCDHYQNNYRAGDQLERTPEEVDAVIAKIKSADSDYEEFAILAEWFGITIDEIYEVQNASASTYIASDDIVVVEPKDIWDLFCNHNYWALGCEGNHINQNGCEVWCIREGTCIQPNCDSTGEVTVKEYIHDWSEGWCGRTCMGCGLIEMFHEEGGCWYCS